MGFRLYTRIPKRILLATVITAQLSCVLTFISKAKIESVSVVPFHPNKTHLFSSSVGKVNKLFPARRSDVSRILKVISPPTDIKVIKPEPYTLSPLGLTKEEDTSKTNNLLSSRFIDKKQSDLIYDKSNNPVITSESWKDLNTILTDEDMKSFLSSLPLHILRNLTSMTRRNPELGQKQLVRMILDRSEYLKKEKQPFKKIAINILENSGETTADGHMKVSGYKTNRFADNEMSMDKAPAKEPANDLNPPILIDTGESQDEQINNDVHHLNPTVSTTTTVIPVLEPPIFETQNSTPSMETEREQRLFTLHTVAEPAQVLLDIAEDNSKTESQDNVVITDNPDTPRQLNSFNSGYYIPPLTNTGPTYIVNGGNNPESSDHHHDDATQFSWQFQPQDPENTYQPHVDKFLNPPSVFKDEIEDSQDYMPSPSVLSSSVWVVDPSSKQNLNKAVNSNSDSGSNKNNPFSGFNSDIKLQPAASSVNMNNGESETNNNIYQEQDGGYVEYHPSASEDAGAAPPFHQNYHYTHTTVNHGRPQESHSVKPVPPQQNTHENYKPNIIMSSSPVKHNGNNNIPNHSGPIEISSNSLSSHHNTHQHQPGGVENSVSNYGNGFNNGWAGHDSYNDWWYTAKNYFSKGGKSTSEKVFEISIAVLSFLAFGGYLLMLIYQVLAVSTAVPVFPLVNGVQNPTLLNAFLGRSSNDQSYNLAFPGEKFEEKYIDQLETIVKQAMDRVKLTFSSMGSESTKDLKGHLLSHL